VINHQEDKKNLKIIMRDISRNQKQCNCFLPQHSNFLSIPSASIIAKKTPLLLDGARSLRLRWSQLLILLLMLVLIILVLIYIF